MIRGMKKHYRYMDLSYDATIDEVLTRQKVMIKMLRSNLNEKRAEKKIKKVARTANIIVEYLQNGGVIKNKQPLFENNKKSIITQLLICIFVVTLAIVSLIRLVY